MSLARSNDDWQIPPPSRIPRRRMSGLSFFPELRCMLPNPAAALRWESLPAFPDPEGFAHMFAQHVR